MSQRDDIACQQVVELLTDHLEGAIPESERARLEAHLAKCGGCAGALRQLEETIRLTGTLTEEQLPPTLRGELQGLFRTWSRAAGP